MLNQHTDASISPVRACALQVTITGQGPVHQEKGRSVYCVGILCAPYVALAGRGAALPNPLLASPHLEPVCTSLLPSTWWLQLAIRTLGLLHHTVRVLIVGWRSQITLAFSASCLYSTIVAARLTSGPAHGQQAGRLATLGDLRTQDHPTSRQLAVATPRTSIEASGSLSRGTRIAPVFVLRLC
ncbi:Hypothetical protein GLP15_4892 [Giardia lamblia P15]|uniref:Uncharacterized protein n=1 Tax=Giardia intestinalis (strain P15) TaxID=658858 RepID=E1F9R5_GIAIA|nr:Hypothetical protein GLP15_4892 [Giardia lamblia P15]